MNNHYSLETMIKWFNQDYQSNIQSKLTFAEVQELLLMSHPRTIFIKTLLAGSSLLDVGAGDGSLQVFRKWPKPNREDIKFYAYAMDKGAAFDLYEAYELGTWPEKKPYFNDRQFDAIVASHFIEHIPALDEFIEWAMIKLKECGRIYLEFPSEYSVTCPTKKVLHDAGIPVVIGNFYDDKTHKEVPSAKQIVQKLENNGFIIDQFGYVHQPFLEEVILSYKEKLGDADYLYPLQAAYWSRTRWARYIIASKQK